MIPMRDGVKLFTVVLSPVSYTGQLPLLIERTPYGADIQVKEDSTMKVDHIPPYFKAMAKEGCIFVFQDMRGKFQSEGVFEFNRPLYHLIDKKKPEDSPIAYDSIQGFIKPPIARFLLWK